MVDQDKQKQAIAVLFALLLVFGVIITSLLYYLEDAKEHCDAYYKEKIEAFIQDNNVCLGNIESRLNGFDMENYFNETGWVIGNED